MAALTYRGAGVDIDAGDALVERIKPFAKATLRPEVLEGIGGFAALCGLPAGLKEPVLVSGTDGVGTKLKIAFAADKHDTIGIDLVAMCVNDVITTGAQPLFFLDYFGTGALDVERAASVVKGIAEGCKQAGAALLGGETAELPGMYAAGEYDLAGFAVGVVERSAIVNGKSVKPGDVVLGLESTGLHSNGYSLARKVLLDHAKLSLDARVPELGETLAEALLRPTPIYARAAAAALSVPGAVHAFSHITGGGLPGNIPRVLPKDLGVDLDAKTWRVPPILSLIQRLGEVELHEMRRTFNMGLGLIVVVAADKADAVLAALRAAGEPAQRVGVVVSRPGVAEDDLVAFV
ncbi:MAG TPA: phosphoribosylformylglycinamidine cyclo-ligase [Polyangiales bacterium]|nr:phosphoribosylformylglycinamidine cyclo-ligase [Polyangiales bacterium]